MTEVKALRKAVAEAEEKAAESRLFVRSTRPGLLKLSRSFKRS